MCGVLKIPQTFQNLACVYIVLETGAVFTLKIIIKVC